MNVEQFTVKKGRSFRLKDHDPRSKGGYSSKLDALVDMEKNLTKLKELQDKLWAQNQYAVLLIIQAMDAAGKDGLIKHVMSGVNPQGCHVVSFKQPSSEELDHDYLWRCVKQLPQRGQIGIFNRSYYEDVLVVRVHDLIKGSQVPPSRINGNFFDQRFEQIRNFEKYLFENGIIPIKFFLNVSKEAQKERFLTRIDDPAKNWKFSMADVTERAHWDDYMHAFEAAIQNTATEFAPWHVLPADRKWMTRITASEIILRTLENLNLAYPTLPADKLEKLQEARQCLMEEDSEAQSADGDPED